VYIKALSVRIDACIDGTTKSKGLRLKLEMTAQEGQVVAMHVTTGDMIFKPILEEGVFHFDCRSSS